jgi:hypothetical protein
MADPLIVFQNIDSPHLRAQVKDFLEELILLSPSDAAVKATFRYMQNRFLVDLKVASESAYMTVIDQARTIGDLLDHTKSKLLDQIKDWRAHRFAC